MPSIYDLKPAFQNLLRPLCVALAQAGWTANQVTLGAMGLSLLAGAAIALWPQSSWPLLLLPLVLLARMALNALDGMLAREYRMQSALGAFLNELGDVIADVGLYLPFAFIPGMDPQPLVALLLLGILTEMSGVVAVQVGASRRYDGPFGKSDRAFLFGLLGLLLGLGFPAGGWTSFVLWVGAGLSAWTSLNRVRAALRELEGHGRV